MHNVLQKASRGRRGRFGIGAGWTSQVSRDGVRYSDTHRPPASPFFSPCRPFCRSHPLRSRLHFALHWWKANNKQHKRPALCPRAHTRAHARTALHKITRPLQGRGCAMAVAGRWVGDSGSWGSRRGGGDGGGGGAGGGYGTTPHKGSPEIAPSHNETCHSVYEIMSNWKHCSHCAPVTGSIVQIALSPPTTSLFPLTQRDCSLPLWQPYPLSLSFSVSLSPLLSVLL